MPFSQRTNRPRVTGVNHKYHFCRDKTRLLSRQKYACHDKHVFVATNICRDKHNFVATKVLSQQAYFCRDKHKAFVVTKIIVVAAPANDSSRASVDPTAAVGVHSDVTDDVGGASLYGGGAGTQRVHPTCLDRNQHRLGKPRQGALSSYTIRQKPPRNIQRGGTLILHSMTESITRHPEKGNSHPTQFDRNHPR